jgi:hypothetical protein
MRIAPLLLLLVGCDAVQGLLGGPGADLAAAERALDAGDFAGAGAAYGRALAARPGDVDAASGVAYVKLLGGDPAGADAVLAAVPPGERAGEIELRRALVALQSGDLDGVKAHGVASARPAGRLLAGEVELADGDRQAARAQFEAVRDAPGEVGALAARYLALLGDANPAVAGLAETQALWALGRRETAVRSVEELVKAYAESHDDGPEQILMWAGRAAAVGEDVVAERLLDAVTVPPPGQGWRMNATRAIARCAAGDVPGCQAGLATVQTLAPPDAYADTAVTAATALAGTDAGAARAIVAGVQGDAAARLLGALGDRTGARAVAMDPVLQGTL